MEALKSHTIILGRIHVVGNDHEIVMRMLLEPEAQLATELRKSTRQALVDHLDMHNKVERCVRTPTASEELGVTA
jgi:hypothetical protein